MGRRADGDIDRDDVLGELRRVAATLDGPVTRRDLSNPMAWAVLRWFCSINAAREAAGLTQPDLNTKWDPERVIDEIRRLSRDGLVITSLALRAADRHDVIGAIAEHIGSIVRARRLARVPDPRYRPHKRQRWDDERVVEEIRRMHRAGECLAQSKVPTALLKGAMYHLGSWRGAIEVAGLDYDEVRLVREPFTGDELLDKLRVLARQRPRMTAGELAHVAWREALVKHFGSVDEALAKVGIHDWPVRLRERALSRKATIAALRSRRREGKSTYMRAVMFDDRALYNSVLVRFPNWKTAITAAKLRNDSPLRKEWTRDSVIAAILARHRTGASMRKADMLRDDSRLYHTASVYFSGRAGALRATGVVVPWALTRWSAERVVDELRRVAASCDHVTVIEAGHNLVSACQRYFGTFSAACRAAGPATEHYEATVARFAGRWRRSA